MQGWLDSSTSTATNQSILPHSILMSTTLLPAQPAFVHHDTWAARYNPELLSKLMPKGIAFLFFSFYITMLLTFLLCRHLQKLESLEICGGRVTDLGVAVLSTVPSLTSLSLAHNLAITDTALPLLARLTNLCSLNLTHSKISGSGLTALYGLTVSCSKPEQRLKLHKAGASGALLAPLLCSTLGV